MSRPRNRLVNAIIFLIAISGLYGYTVLSPKATAPEHIALANELREGYGRAEMNDGTVYVGNFVNGMYQGKGRFETADGQIYEGNFEKNALTGDGTYTDKEGSRYEGEFVDWKFHGAGTYLDAEGTVFKGQFVDGTLTGLGRMAEKQGVRYDGEFKQWRMHGQGTLRLANGDEYIGTFADDTYQGEGTLKYANPAQAGRAEDSGTWHRGILEDKELAPRIRAALPDQRSLLDSAFAKLIPQDPANIDLYFLAVAGDSSQEVFRRGRLRAQKVRSRIRYRGAFSDIGKQPQYAEVRSNGDHNQYPGITEGHRYSHGSAKRYSVHVSHQPWLQGARVCTRPEWLGFAGSASQGTRRHAQRDRHSLEGHPDISMLFRRVH